MAWIDTDELNTLETKYATNKSFVDAFTGGYIDDDTLEAIYSTFHWRKMCDNDMFPEYLNSIFTRYGQQYEDLLHVQLTRIDPMVTKYLERQLLHGGQDVKNTNGFTNRTGSDQTDYGKTETTVHGEIITDEKGTKETFTHGEVVTDEKGTKETFTHGESIHQGGTETETTSYGQTIQTKGIDNRTLTKRQTETEKRTDEIAKRHTENSGTSSGSGVSDSRSLNASLPRVDSYSASGINAPGVVTLPDGGSASGMVAGAFDWRNADSQSETAGANSTSGSTSGSSDTSVQGNDISTTETSYAGDGDTDNLSRDMTDTHGGEDTRTLLPDRTESHTGDDITAHDGQDTTRHAGDDITAHEGQNTTRHTGEDALKHAGSDKITHTGTDTSNGSETINYGGDDRERYTGRDGSPAELLQKAREYIQSTGAFSWLCRRVDTCFLDVYDY